MFDLRWKNEAIGDLDTDICFASSSLASCSSSMASSSYSMDEADVLSCWDRGAAVAPVGKSELIWVDGVVVRASLCDASLEMGGLAISRAGDAATTGAGDSVTIGAGDSVATGAGSAAEVVTGVLCDASTGTELSAAGSDDSRTTVASSSDESVILGDFSPAAGTILFSDTEVGRVEVCPDSITDVGE